jgi:lipopolysaccharide export system permease protein
VVLATIVMTIILIRTLGQASKGSVNPSEVMLIMGLTVMGHLTTILTLSLFIAIVATRAYEKYGVDVPALIGSAFGILAAISILTYKKLGGAH